MAVVEQVDWLETFVAVVEHGSFSDAARALHRSQPRVSAHVASLERALGGTLLDRRHRPVAPTDLGAAFLPYARRALRTLEDGADVVSRHAEEVHGRVVIGCHPSVSAGFLPGVLAEVHRRHPGIRVELTEHTTPDIVAGLESGQFHIAVHSMVHDPAGEGMLAVPLWCEEHVVVVPEGHALACAAQPVDARRIAQHSVIAIARPGSAVDPDIAGALTAWGLELEVAWQSEMPATVVALSRSGLGVGVLNSLAAQVTDLAGMRVLRVRSTGHGRRTGMSRDRRRAPSAAVDAVFGLMQQAPRPPGTLPPRDA